MNYFKYISYLVVFIGLNSAIASPADDLLKVAEIDQVTSLKRMLDKGADPNAVNAEGQPAIIVALQNESFAAAALLADAPATNVNLANPLGESPLMMAAIKGQLELCRRLIERGAKVNLPSGAWTPLHYAATGPDPAIVDLLLQRGAAINALSPNQSTPLMLAAGYGPDDAVVLLLARGANAALRNQRNMTAADFASHGGREELAKRLSKAAQPP